VIPKYSLLLLIISQLHTFEDSDIDGVSNSQDLCPDISFEDTVDEYGCPEKQNYWGKISLSLGADINRNESTTTDYNFFIDYNYQKWDIALYSSQQSSMDMDTNSNKSNATGDLYLSMGYTIDSHNLSTKLSLGSKFSTGDDEVSTGENDYFTSLNFSYILNEKTALISQLNYTLLGDSNETNCNNILSYSLGVGYMLNSRWYSSVLYQRANSIYQDNDDYQAVSLFNSYIFNDTFFGILNYSRGLDTLSYDHTISLKLGVTFE
jgi:hypothetical protein